MVFTQNVIELEQNKHNKLGTTMIRAHRAKRKLKYEYTYTPTPLLSFI